MALKWKAQRSRRLKWKTHGLCVKMRIEQPKNAKNSCSESQQRLRIVPSAFEEKQPLVIFTESGVSRE
jgi:hypothetical protein